MNLKNTEIVELAKFFLFDPDALKIQYTFEANAKMKENVKAFTETYKSLVDMEQNITLLKSSKLYKEFYEDLKDLVKDHLKKNEDGTLQESEKGEIPILPGKDQEVFKAQEDLSNTEKYKDFWTAKKQKEADLKTTLAATNTTEIKSIKLSQININDLTLTPSQWNLLSVLIEPK